MPLTEGFASRTSLKGEGHIHTDKWHRCIEHVKANSPGVEPHAVCTHSIGYAGSVNPEHRRQAHPPSSKPSRFKTKEGRRNARAREKAAKMDYADVLKFTTPEPEAVLVRKEHMCWGHVCGGGGKGGERKVPLPHGKVSEAHQKELGLKPGRYTNKPGVGIMGRSHEEIKRGPAEAATTNADVKSSVIARDKKKNASHLEHNQAAKAHSEAAKEHEKLGNTKEAAHHKEKAKFHRGESARIKGK